MSIFVFTKANIEWFKHKPTVEACRELIQPSPYWLVDGRICYHVHETPDYIFHNNLPLRYIPEIYDSYVHVLPNKKFLYAMASYSHADLVDMATRLQLPLGTKAQMYAKIKEEMEKSMMNFKKIDSR